MDYIYAWKFDTTKNRWNLWYIIAFSILAWVVIWAFITTQYMLWFLAILMSWVYFFVENNSPENLEVYLTELWIKVDNSFYEYSSILYYTVIYSWENANILRLYLDKKITNILDLKIDNNIIIELNPILNNYIKENKNWWYSLIDKIVIFLKL